MTAGSKVQDSKQEYQYSQPFVTPSGHEFSFYDTPENERLIIKHTSGSHIEFKADGSIFIKAAKDLHTHSSVNSSGSEVTKGADNTTQRSDTDYTWEVGGRLRIKCSELDFEIGSTGRIIAGTDLVTSANNVITKGTESISLEGTKSIYMDTKELRERVVARQSEQGTATSQQTPGGVNVMKVHGNAIIQNDDPNGGITIASAGYLNLVCGKERIDLIGRYIPTPSAEGLATFTQKVYANKGLLDRSLIPGDYYFQSDAGATKVYSMLLPGSTVNKTDGLHERVVLGNETHTITVGNDTRTVLLGNQTETVSVGNQTLLVGAGNRTRLVGLNETVTIAGIQKVTAAKIYLN
jgi:hypothetical protein